MRVRTIVVVAMVVGTAAAIGSDGSSFAKTFWFLFWAGIVGIVLLLARFGRASEEITHIEMVDLDPWVDQDGVRHFPGDVFDIENHPRTGAHGHL
ncbi:MAG: hypothetical protein JF606_13130 [Burkholderiales bacterium]|jgi:hypothetical protein|nr:hypothetical protein [Burkholderiales bacterium]